MWLRVASACQEPTPPRAGVNRFQSYLHMHLTMLKINFLWLDAEVSRCVTGAQASRGPTGSEVPRARRRVPVGPLWGRLCWLIRQAQFCSICFQGTVACKTRVKSLGARLGGSAVT